MLSTLVRPMMSSCSFSASFSQSLMAWTQRCTWDVGATGELAAVQQRHFGAVLILRVLGAIDETGQIPAILVAKTADFFSQLSKPGQQGHHTMTGVDAARRPDQRATARTDRTGYWGLLAVGGLRHETRGTGADGRQDEIIPGVGPDGDQTAESRIGEIGGSPPPTAPAVWPDGGPVQRRHRCG